MKDYSIEFFIRKFQAIHEDEIGIGSIESNCALKHCAGNSKSKYYSEEGLALARIFDPITTSTNIVYEINDGIWWNKRFPEHWFDKKTPKQRILHALYDVYQKTYGRKYEHPEPKSPEVVERVVYVSFDASVRELQKQLNEN